MTEKVVLFSIRRSGGAEECWEELGRHAGMDAEHQSHTVHGPELAAADAADAPMARGGVSTVQQEALPVDLPPSPPLGRHLDAGSSVASMLGREEEEKKMERNEGQFGHSV
uniref:Uncharacterized protein n=1 Tax=Oryza glumipatula TaxID=40148 RepID=A0A0D9Y992_9ORYZ